MRILALALILLVTACGQTAVSPTFGAADGGPSVLLSAGEARGAYGAVARVEVTGVCSGALLRARAADAPAYVLSNGHCARAFGTDEVFIDEAAVGSITFDYFHDAPERPIFPVRRLPFSTMKGTDLAILELGVPYGDLARRGIAGFAIERERPDIDEPVVVVGAPLQSTPAESFMRLAACRLGGEVPLLLERHWHWFDFVRNRCRDLQPGSSGSPVISRRDGRLLGLINTTTVGSEGTTDCWLGRPCEVDGTRGRSMEGTSYAVPLWELPRCFDGEGLFRLDLPGCPLDDGRQLRLEPAWMGARNPALAATGTGGARWDIRVGGTAFALFRYKTGPAGSVDCRSPSGYGDPQRVSIGSRISDTLPEAEGHYAACVLGTKGSNSVEGGQGPRNASMVTLEIDKTAPRVAPRFDVQNLDTSWSLSPVYAPPEITLYLFKFGSLVDTDCAARSGYRSFLAAPFTISKAQGPVLFCAIGEDLARNPTPVLEIRLE